MPIPFCMATSLFDKSAERRRLQAMALLNQGWSQSEVARHFGVTPAAVCQWVKAFRRDGPEALKARPHPGAPSRLTESQLKQLEQLLLAGARQQGYCTELWTLPRVVELIGKHFGVKYDASGVWHVLRRMGWSCQKPERRARERSEEAVGGWRKQRWPNIKKSSKKR
jgi:transposase